MSRSTEGLHAVSAVRRSTLGRRRGRRRAGRLAGLRLPCGAAPGASCSGIPAARGRGPPLGQGRAVRGGPEFTGCGRTGEAADCKARVCDRVP